MTEQDPTLSPADHAAPGTPNTGETLCPDCSGSGKVDGQTCGACRGTGRVIEGIGGA
jgi:DnaJ-class molecular chaperone